MKKVLLIIVIFLLGLYFCLNYSSEDVKEGFKKKDSPRCANVLYQDGEKINLLNTGLARIPGVNPLVFNNLDEYVEFTKWQLQKHSDPLKQRPSTSLDLPPGN